MTSPSLVRRTQAVEATMAVWKDRPFSMPKNDCVKLWLFNMKQLGIPVRNSAKLIGYKNPLQARAILRKVYGVPTVPEFLDKFYERITPAHALPSDVMAMPTASEALGAIGLYMGNDLVYAYVDDDTLEAGAVPHVGRLTYDEGSEPLAAWRMPV